MEARGQRHGLFGRSHRPDDLQVRLILQHRDQSVPHDGMVVDDEDADHVVSSRGSGILIFTVVPPRGRLCTCNRPPTSAARSRIPTMPWCPSPMAWGSKPCPSSWIERYAALSVTRSVMATSWAPAWARTLASASWRSEERRV